jgi:alpha-L-fucosidase
MDRERITPDEYTPFAKDFKAERYDPAAWAQLAKDAGCRYMVLTTRHHDGYCLWDSQVSDFTATKLGPSRDLVAEYAEACRAAGLKVGFYYSLKDWRHPDYFAGHRGDAARHRVYLDYVHAQVDELLTNYGQIDILWYDGPSPYDAEAWEAAKLNDRARELQPEILINDRSRLPEDMDTPEQHVKASPPDRAWETCLTTNGSWGWHAGDTEWKPVQTLIQTLIQTASGGGNLLLNVGPRADGTIPDETADRFREIGDWMRVNSESVRDSARHIFQWAAFGLHTVVGTNLYCHLRLYPGETLTVVGIKNKVTSAALLGGGELDFEQRGDRLRIGGLPASRPGVIPVVRLVSDGVPEFVAGGPNLGWPG